MEDWFNVLIGVIAIVLAITGAKNKKKETEKKRRNVSTPTPSSSPDDFFGELRRAMAAETEDELFGKDTESEEEEEEVPAYTSTPAYSGRSYERQTVVDEVPAPAIVVEENVQPTTSFNEDDLTRPYQGSIPAKKKIDLDAEKMIIFSAILKPKFEEI